MSRSLTVTITGPDDMSDDEVRSKLQALMDELNADVEVEPADESSEKFSSYDDENEARETREHQFRVELTDAKEMDRERERRVALMSDDVFVGENSYKRYASKEMKYFYKSEIALNDIMAEKGIYDT